MTLFVVKPRRQVEINDAYFGALLFIISYMLTKLVMKAIEREKIEKNRYITGGFELDLKPETSNFVLSCILD